MPVVFISYSHDSEAHREQVLGFAQRLRVDGFDTRLDRFLPGSPPEGWPRWMLDQLDAADFVLLVCTETYYRRFRGHEVPGLGKGVDWEGSLITLEIYEARSKTQKFVPVLFSEAEAHFVPEPLRGQTHYLLDSNGYAAIVDFLAGSAGVEPAPIGKLEVKPRRQAVPMTFDSQQRIARQFVKINPRDVAVLVEDLRAAERLKRERRFHDACGRINAKFDRLGHRGSSIKASAIRERLK